MKAIPKLNRFISFNHRVLLYLHENVNKGYILSYKITLFLTVIPIINKIKYCILIHLIDGTHIPASVERA